MEMLPVLGRHIVAGSKKQELRPIHFLYWGHGFGWRGSKKVDLSHPDTELSAKSFTAALKNFMSVLQKNGISESGRLDTLIFDACVMATLENIFEFQEVADNQVVAPSLVPENGILFSTLPILNSSAVEFAQKNSEPPRGDWVGRRFLAITRPQVDISLREAVRAWVDYLRVDREKALVSYKTFEKNLRLKGGSFIGVSTLDFVSESSRILSEVGFTRRPIPKPVFFPEVRLDLPWRIELLTEGDSILKKSQELSLARELAIYEYYKELR